MRIWNFLVLMDHSLVISDEPMEHRLLIAKHGLELQDILTTGHINAHGVGFRSSDALDRKEVTQEELLKIQARVKRELSPLAACAGGDRRKKTKVPTAP